MFGLREGGAIRLAPEGLAVLQQRREAGGEIGLLAMLERLQQRGLPLASVLQPAAILLAKAV